ncbi:hypothetical protein VCHENC03_3991 [Vibrio sp. HENC-03]|nr:hypothetical protein VCHENC03_3991 [Vibrio sp. HENC-03]
MWLHHSYGDGYSYHVETDAHYQQHETHDDDHVNVSLKNN